MVPGARIAPFAVQAITGGVRTGMDRTSDHHFGWRFAGQLSGTVRRDSGGSTSAPFFSLPVNPMLWLYVQRTSNSHRPL